MVDCHGGEVLVCHGGRVADVDCHGGRVAELVDCHGGRVGPVDVDCQGGRRVEVSQGSVMDAGGGPLKLVVSQVGGPLDVDDDCGGGPLGVVLGVVVGRGIVFV